MTTSSIGEADVGGFFQGPDGQVWRLIMYAASPTATFEQVTEVTGQRERRGGVVGSPILDGFVRLVPEGQIAEDAARLGGS